MSTKLRHSIRAGLLCVVVSSLVSCESSTTRPADVVTPVVELPAAPFLLSSPVARASASQSAVAQAATAEPTVVYVSLPPGSLSSGTAASISVRRTGAAVTVPLMDGGFDPVAVDASMGDTIAVSVAGANAGAANFVFTVPRNAKPVIVRTDPPPHKRDVPLNLRALVVFSVPVDVTSLDSTTVYLLRNGAKISGRLTFGNAEHTLVQFESTGPLLPNTDYEIVVWLGIRAVTGSVLENPATVPFTTVLPPPTQSAVASVNLGGLRSANMLLGNTLEVGAYVRDALGRPLSGRNVHWTSTATSGFTISSANTVTIADGSTSIVVQGLTAFASTKVYATSEGVSSTDTVFVTVIPPESSNVKDFTLSPSALTLQQGTATDVQLTARTASGELTIDYDVTWKSSNPAIATVADGFERALVAGIAPGGPVAITATINGMVRTVSVTVTPATSQNDNLAFASVSTGFDHSCALTRDGVAYCWGGNSAGQLGDGTVLGRLAPAKVAGEHTFRSISAGESGTCAVTVGGDGYCWGDASYDSFDDHGPSAECGYHTCQPALVPRIDGQTFGTFSVGQYHTCAVTSNGTGYCWGYGAYYGSLGAGTSATCVQRGFCTEPIAIEGHHVFASVSAGAYISTCGLEASGAAYCWGVNDSGALGTGSVTAPEDCFFEDFGGFVPCAHAPLAVAGNVSFRSITTGMAGSCGLSVQGMVYCWGVNPFGQFGMASPDHAVSPLLLPSGVTFTVLSMGGGGSVCGVSVGQRAYCWGNNSDGALGDGTQAMRATPAPVVGDLRFVSVSVGGTYLGYVGHNHVCGVTVDGAVYCWGRNASGQLGIASTAASSTPVKVGGR